MTYDNDEEKNHSSLELAQKCVDYWTNKRSVPKEKVLIGIPFYSRPSAILYSELITKPHFIALSDYYKEESYNGMDMVRQKTNYAQTNCGGLIIWAINYDSFDKTSLLKAIWSTT